MFAYIFFIKLAFTALLNAPTSTANLNQHYVSIPSNALQRIEFLGFSKTERISAWRIQVRQPQVAERTIDHYTLISLVDADTKQPIMNIRQSTITRRNLSGQVVPTPIKTLTQQNQAWNAAGDMHLWNRLSSRAKFKKHLFPHKETAIRLMQDESLNNKIEADEKQITLTTTQGTPVGFVPMARRMDGIVLPMAHFQYPTGPDQHVKVVFTAYYSESGLHLAGIAHFIVQDNEHHTLAEYDEAALLPLGNEPLGIYHYGTFRMVRHHQRIMREKFLSVHPDAKEMYDEFIEAEIW